MQGREEEQWPWKGMEKRDLSAVSQLQGEVKPDRTS